MKSLIGRLKRRLPHKVIYLRDNLLLHFSAHNPTNTPLCVDSVKIAIESRPIFNKHELFAEIGLEISLILKN